MPIDTNSTTPRFSICDSLPAECFENSVLNRVIGSNATDIFCLHPGVNNDFTGNGGGDIYLVIGDDRPTTSTFRDYDPNQDRFIFCRVQRSAQLAFLNAIRNRASSAQEISFRAFATNITIASNSPSPTSDLSSSTLGPSQRLLLTAAIPSVILAIVLIVLTSTFCVAWNRRRRQHAAQFRQATANPTITDAAEQINDTAPPSEMNEVAPLELTTPDHTNVMVASDDATSGNANTRPFQSVTPEEPLATQDDVAAVV